MFFFFLTATGFSSNWSPIRPIILTELYEYLRVIVIVFSQMVPCSERHVMRVVGWRGNGDRACASHVQMTQHEWERLQFVRREIVIVMKHVVVWWPACSLSTEKERQNKSHQKNYSRSNYQYLNFISSSNTYIKINKYKNSKIYLLIFLHSTPAVSTTMKSTMHAIY